MCDLNFGKWNRKIMDMLRINNVEKVINFIQGSMTKVRCDFLLMVIRDKLTKQENEINC